MEVVSKYILTDDMQVHLEAMDYVKLRELPGRGVVALKNFAFTIAIVYGIDEFGNYEGRWCYNGWADASKAIKAWDGAGDPPGNWIKYKGVGGERSNPNTQS